MTSRLLPLLITRLIFAGCSIALNVVPLNSRLVVYSKQSWESNVRKGYREILLGHLHTAPSQISFSHTVLDGSRP